MASASNSKKCKRDTENDSSCKCGAIMDYRSRLLEALLEARRDEKLCDGIIKCADGTEFKIHRVVLSIASPYFKVLFTNSINRNCNEIFEAKINGPSKIVNLLLDFAYVGRCDITEHNVNILIKLADQYQMLDLVYLCEQFLLKHLHVQNCLERLECAQLYGCQILEEGCMQYILNNFSEILNTSEEFEVLSVSNVIKILSCDELQMINEKTVFRALQKWVEYNMEERKEHVFDLLNCVRLGQLSLDYLSSSVLRWKIVENNNDYFNFICNAMEMKRNFIASDDHRITSFMSNILRPRVHSLAIFMVGGRQREEKLTYQLYDATFDRWSIITGHEDDPFSTTLFHQLCELNGVIYMIGGITDRTLPPGKDNLSSFDPLTGRWRDLAPMHNKRVGMCVVALQGYIHVIGGAVYISRNNVIMENSTERYNPATNQWEIICPMQTARARAGAASLYDKIFVAGGIGYDGQSLNSAEMYDPATNQWTYIANMRSMRSDLSLVACQGALYALCGKEDRSIERWKAPERLRPNTTMRNCVRCRNHIDMDVGVWVKIAKMKYPRSFIGTSVLNDKIYIIGGVNNRLSEYYTSDVYCFSPATGELSEAVSLNSKRLWFAACVVKNFPKISEYGVQTRENWTDDF